MKLEKLREQFRRKPDSPPKLLPSAGRDAESDLPSGYSFSKVRESLLRLARWSAGWPKGTGVWRLPYREDQPVEASDDVYLNWRPVPKQGKCAAMVIVSIETAKTNRDINDQHRTITYTVPSFPGETP